MKRTIIPALILLLLQIPANAQQDSFFGPDAWVGHIRIIKKDDPKTGPWSEYAALDKNTGKTVILKDTFDVQKVLVPSGTKDMKLDRDTGRLYLAVDNSVLVYNTSDWSLRRKIDTGNRSALCIDVYRGILAVGTSMGEPEETSGGGVLFFNTENFQKADLKIGLDKRPVVMVKWLDSGRLITATNADPLVWNLSTGKITGVLRKDEKRTGVSITGIGVIDSSSPFISYADGAIARFYVPSYSGKINLTPTKTIDVGKNDAAYDHITDTDHIYVCTRMGKLGVIDRSNFELINTETIDAKNSVTALELVNEAEILPLIQGKKPVAVPVFGAMLSIGIRFDKEEYLTSFVLTLTRKTEKQGDRGRVYTRTIRAERNSREGTKFFVQEGTYRVTVNNASAVPEYGEIQIKRGVPASLNLQIPTKTGDPPVKKTVLEPNIEGISPKLWKTAENRMAAAYAGASFLVLVKGGQKSPLFIDLPGQPGILEVSAKYVAAAVDTGIYIYDWEGKRIRLIDTQGAVSQLAIFDNIAAAVLPDRLQTYNIASGKALASWPHGAGEIRTIGFSLAGDLYVSLTGRLIYKLNPQSCAEDSNFVYIPRDSAANCFLFLENGLLLAGFEKETALIDTLNKSGYVIRSYQNAEGTVSAAFLHGGVPYTFGTGGLQKRNSLLGQPEDKPIVVSPQGVPGPLSKGNLAFQDGDSIKIADLSGGIRLRLYVSGDKNWVVLRDETFAGSSGELVKNAGGGSLTEEETAAARLSVIPEL
jgi:hypothetical protein